MYFKQNTSRCVQVTSCLSWRVQSVLQRSLCLISGSWATEVTGLGSCWRSWGTSGGRCPSKTSGRHNDTVSDNKLHHHPACSLFKLMLIRASSLSVLPQPDDQHHAERHHQHAAVAQYGEVLERSARYLCDAQTSGGTPEERSVQETTNHRSAQTFHVPVSASHVSNCCCSTDSWRLVSFTVDTMCLKWAPPKNKQAKLSKKWEAEPVTSHLSISQPVHIICQILLLCPPGESCCYEDSLYIAVRSICQYFLKIYIKRTDLSPDCFFLWNSFFHM